MGKATHHHHVMSARFRLPCVEFNSMNIAFHVTMAYAIGVPSARCLNKWVTTQIYSALEIDVCTIRTRARTISPRYVYSF